MLGITDYLWRLLPGNPILLRVVESGGKKRRDLLIRCAYLGLLILLVLYALLTNSGTIGGTSLEDLAKVSSKIFEQMSYLQLGLVCLLAPIFTAGAITQEKDSQTYDILLATPMSNGQIVLGSMLSRLFFVVALLLSGIPVFSITQVFGGVAIKSIVVSCTIAAVTALVTGALATAIATLKVGTRRTIFSFYMFVVIYMVGLFLVDRLPYLHPYDATGKPIETSWLTGIHPFLALETIFNTQGYRAPDYAALPPALQTWPIGWYLSSPASFYITFTTLLSIVLVLPSIVLLRTVAQSTLTPKAWILTKLRISSGDRNRKPRPVWQNPVAWREAKTKASASRAVVLRYGFMSIGIIGALALLVLYASEDLSLPYGYVTPNSYDSGAGTLTVMTAEKAATYKITPKSTIQINGNESSLDHLDRKMELRVPQTANGSVLTGLDLIEIPRRLPPKETRTLLLGAVIVEFAVILLVVTNAAASTVTREKEDGSLDLLLTSPITSRYYIWGKLRGLVAFVIPLIAVPVASVAMFVIYDSFTAMTRTDTGQWIVYPEAIVIMPATLILVSAFAAMVGMNMSLRMRTTVRAVMASVGIVVGVCSALGWCGYGALSSMGGSDIPIILSFTVLTILIDPMNFGGKQFIDPASVAEGRTVLFICAFIATGVYAAAVWSMYKTMVKNFDMTIRRQSR
jgi:ABC-type Na+ efflux pump permease subunit